MEKVGHAQTEEHVSGAVATAMVQVKRKHDIAALELLGDNRGVNHTPENVDNIMELAAAIIRVMMLDGLTTASRQKRTKILRFLKFSRCWQECRLKKAKKSVATIFPIF